MFKNPGCSTISENLRIEGRRLTSENALVFWAVRMGARDRVKRLLKLREASPTHAGYPEGKTISHVSFFCETPYRTMFDWNHRLQWDL